MKYKQNWNLENIFPGGYDSPQANARLKELNQDLGTLATELAALDLAKDAPTYHGLSDYLKHRETDINGLMELNVFWTAHQSADFNNTAIGPKLAQVSEAFSTFKDLEISFGKKLAGINDDDFKALIVLPDFKEIAFNLTEDRKLAAEQLDEKSESIINKLAIDGFTGWSTHYDTIASQISVPYTDENGKTQTLSAGQALNQLTGAPDNNTRKNIMSAYEKAWGSQEAVVGDTACSSPTWIVRQPCWANKHMTGRIKLHQLWLTVMKAKRLTTIMRLTSSSLTSVSSALRWQTLPKPRLTTNGLKLKTALANNQVATWKKSLNAKNHAFS